MLALSSGHPSDPCLLLGGVVLPTRLLGSVLCPCWFLQLPFEGLAVRKWFVQDFLSLESLVLRVSKPSLGVTEAGGRRAGSVRGGLRITS